MGIHVTTTCYGAAALDALAGSVRAMQAGQPLRPVAVVVPTNTAGVMARRALGRRGGFAAIDVMTTFRLAEVLGAPALHAAGRRPVSTPVVDLAVRQIVRDNPGLYAGVQHHQSTIVALRDLYRELRQAGAGSMTALARTERGGEPARVAAEVARRLRNGWYDEGDLLAHAIARARHDLPDRLRHVVVHVPQRLRPLELELVMSIAERGDVEVVIGLTGDAAADADVRSFAATLAGGDLPAEPPRTAAGRVEVVSTTDADDEVRIAVRAVVDAARGGTRFDRIAVLYPTERPYARLVEHHLGAADVPWNGHPGTGVDERMVPRVLIDLLDLDRRGLRRSNLMTLLGDVPARDADGAVVPTARWERVGRAAGVVREGDWTSHLRRYAHDVRTADRWDATADADAAVDLLAFVDRLRGELGDPATRRPWADWVAWSKANLERWFGSGRLDLLGGPDGQAWEQTSRVLDRLAHLDGIGAPVDRAEFRTTFIAELEITPGRHGRIGNGVHVSTLAGAAGIDVDVAIVLGAAEGLLPPNPSTDPLLGDRERELAGLARSDELAGLVHRQFLAAVTTTVDALVTVPRGDLRATATRHPSRWLAPLLERAAGHVVVASHAQGLASTAFPASAAEHRLRALWTQVRAGADVRTLDVAADDPVIRRALALRDGRASDRFTAFDGNVAGQPVGPLPRRVSPTRIEAWPACPHAYFVRYVLGVQPIEEPESIETLSALDRGSALHDAIDRLHRAVLTGEVAPPGDLGWGSEHLDALLAAGAEVADLLEARGRTGREAFWANARKELLDALRAWMTFDAAQWRGGRVVASEQRFGEDEPVTLSIPGGRTVGFFGSIDRVDELSDGSLVVVDHKTGRPRGLEKLSADDPTLGGTRFQLPVYATAARAVLGRPDVPVEAGYTFFRPFSRVGVAFDDDVWQRVGVQLGRVVEGIEAGLFPPRPEAPGWRMWPSCWYCEPDGLGTATRWAEWERKRHDPLLAPWFGDPGPAGDEVVSGDG